MKIYNPADCLTPTEMTIIVGGIMGDSSIQRNPGPNGNARIIFRQGWKQFPYLEWKVQQLQRWIASPIQGPVFTQFGGAVYSASTVSHPVFTQLHSIIGRKGQRPLAALPYLTDLGLAVWYMDDGSYSPVGRGVASFHTECYLPADVDALALWLTDRGITSHTKMDKRGPIIYVTADGTRELVHRIRPYIHPVMAYKVGAESEQPSGLPTIQPSRATCIVCGGEFLRAKSKLTCGSECAKRNSAKLHRDYKQRQSTV